MRPSPLLSGIVYIALGVIFTIIAIQNVQINGEWGFLTYLFVLIATFDFGSGIKLILLHFKLKSAHDENNESG